MSSRSAATDVAKQSPPDFITRAPSAHPGNVARTTVAEHDGPSALCLAARMTHPHVVRHGASVPLIAVHGNGVDHRLLLALDDSLAEGGAWERTYLDLPGFGSTPALTGEGGLPHLAQWLTETTSALVGSAPFALVANSLGGLLARHLVAQFGDQVLGLALIAPVVDPDASRRTRPERTVVDRDEELLAELTDADRDEFTGMAVRQTRDSWAAFERWALPGVRAADPDAMQRLAADYALGTVPEERGPTFRGPTLVVAGRQDHVVGYEDQLRLLPHYPRASALVVDAAGHNVHLEQPAIVGAAVADWARRTHPDTQAP